MKVRLLQDTHFANPAFDREAWLLDPNGYTVPRKLTRPKGEIVEGEQVWLMARNGQAVPEDDECRKYLEDRGVTSEDLVKAQRINTNLRVIEGGFTKAEANALAKKGYDIPKAKKGN